MNVTAQYTPQWRLMLKPLLILKPEIIAKPLHQIALNLICGSGHYHRFSVMHWCNFNTEFWEPLGEFGLILIAISFSVLHFCSRLYVYDWPKLSYVFKNVAGRSYRSSNISLHVGRRIHVMNYWSLYCVTPQTAKNRGCTLEKISCSSTLDRWTNLLCTYELPFPFCVTKQKGQALNCNSLTSIVQIWQQTLIFVFKVSSASKTTCCVHQFLLICSASFIFNEPQHVQQMSTDVCTRSEHKR